MLRARSCMVEGLEQKLIELYGSTNISGQIDRYARAQQHFIKTYGTDPTHIFRALGRVNLIGEHTDYNYGYIMPVAIDKDIVILAKRML